MNDELFGTTKLDPERPGQPAWTPQSKEITTAELERLEAVYAASTQTQAGYCTANNTKCPCRILYMNPEVGFSTYNVEDEELASEPNEDGTRNTVVMNPRGISKADIIAFVEAKNALPDLIQMARKALAYEKALQEISDLEDSDDARDAAISAVRTACAVLGKPAPTFGVK